MRQLPLLVSQSRPALGVAALVAAVVLGSAPAAHAYTPESPEVVEMVERGVAYLEANHAQFQGNYREGAVMLSAYTHFKIRHDAEHPIVRRGLDMALHIAGEAREGLPIRTHIVYEASVAILLLIDVDPVRYATEIQTLANGLIAVQRPHGGFGYLTEELGDTSQTQYVVLAFWTLDQADFEVPNSAMQRVVEYLLRTQDPTGQWGYKGNISPRVGVFVRQDALKGHSLTAAGGGSVLIGGDFFGLWRSSKTLGSEVTGLPPALQLRQNVEEMRAKRESFKMPAETLLGFINRTDDWFEANPYERPKTKSWYYYYMYTRERYESFLEVALGRQEKEPDWYNQGVEELMRYQSADGGWGAGGPDDHALSPPDVATSLAILYLIRSTKRAIGELGEGVLAGGYDLPSDTRDIRVEGTQVKGKPVVTAVTDLLGLLEGEDPSSLESGSIPEDLQLAEDPAERRQQISRLQRLARGSQSFQARRVAVRLLGQSDSLDVVPTLIFVLRTDPDTKARIYARDGLRFISRKFDGFGLPDDPSREEIEEAVKAWRQWYNQLDPSYVFLD